MGLHEGSGQLNKAVKELMGRWGELRGEWDDPVSREFEKDHLLPLEQSLRSALSAMDHMGTILQQIRRDCQ